MRCQCLHRWPSSHLLTPPAHPPLTSPFLVSPCGLACLGPQELLFLPLHYPGAWLVLASDFTERRQCRADFRSSRKSVWIVSRPRPKRFQTAQVCARQGDVVFTRTSPLVGCPPVQVQVQPCRICADFGGLQKGSLRSQRLIVSFSTLATMCVIISFRYPSAQLKETTSKCRHVSDRATYSRAPASRRHPHRYIVDHS